MPKINILPKNIAELIAAGEVVERPASAIKELVENSIDAGSKKITVEIQNGGIRYIRITDDGCGIGREDAAKAFISHATSKVSKAEDLNAIYTLGFRGEALASIAAVSKVEMLTKPADCDFGTRYIIEGGKEILTDDAGCPDGTTIVVRDLFYNTPARMKFLKKDVTEGNYVSDIVTKTALANPDVSFRLIKDGKQVLFTSGDGQLRNAAAAVFGKDFAASLIPCDYALNGIHVGGFVSLPRSCKPTRNSQYFFVNSRFVKIPVGAAALDEAYKNTIMVGKFPACIIDLTIPPETVDVNVHPAKTEVRFADDKRIFEAIYYAAKNAVTTQDVRPKMDLSILNKNSPFRGDQIEISVRDADRSETQRPAQTPLRKVGAVSGQREELTAADPKNTEKKVVVYTVDDRDLMQVSSPKQPEDFALGSTTGEGRLPEVKKHVNIDIVADDDDIADTQNKAKQAAELSVASVEAPAEDTGAATELSASAPCAEQKRADSADSEEESKQIPYFRYLGEAFKTYLLVECEDKLLMIDKHALHERMLFREIKAGGACTAPQALMFPATIHLDRKEYIAVSENTDALSSLGFSLEDFGEGTILVRECPMMFVEQDIASVVCALAGALLEHRKELLTEQLDWLYHSASCRAAVKGGKPLADSDALMLIERVLSDDSLRYCPHGRPVLIELSRHELEKQFGRIT